MMRFFVKVAMVCNACFIISVILRFVDIAFQKKGNYDGVLLYQPLKSTIIILGYGGAILMNFLCLITYIITKLIQPKQVTAISNNDVKELSKKWLFILLIFFLAQVYYFFFSSF